MPLGVGRGQNVGLRDFCHSLTLLPPGASVFHKHMSSLCIYLDKGRGGALMHVYVLEHSQALLQIGLMDVYETW